MSDAAEPALGAAPPPGAPSVGHELEVDLAAFLPEGTEPDDAGSGSGPVEAASSDARPTAAEPVVDLDALAAVEHALDAVEQSLVALDDGTYGRCRVCGQPVPTDDLLADPVRRSCAVHA